MLRPRHQVDPLEQTQTHYSETSINLIPALTLHFQCKRLSSHLARLSVCPFRLFLHIWHGIRPYMVPCGIVNTHLHFLSTFGSSAGPDIHCIIGVCLLRRFHLFSEAPGRRRDWTAWYGVGIQGRK